MTIRMISNGGHRYRNRMMVAGEEFEVDGQTQRNLMLAMKWATDAPVKGPDRTVTAAPGSLAPRNQARKPTGKKVEPEKPTSPPSTNNDAANKRPDDVDDKVAEPATPTSPRGEPHAVGSVTSLGGKDDSSSEP